MFTDKHKGRTTNFTEPCMYIEGRDDFPDCSMNCRVVRQNRFGNSIDQVRPLNPRLQGKPALEAGLKHRLHAALACGFGAGSHGRTCRLGKAGSAAYEGQ